MPPAYTARAPRPERQMARNLSPEPFALTALESNQVLTRVPARAERSISRRLPDLTHSGGTPPALGFGQPSIPRLRAPATSPPSVTSAGPDEAQSLSALPLVAGTAWGLSGGEYAPASGPFLAVRPLRSLGRRAIALAVPGTTEGLRHQGR